MTAGLARKTQDAPGTFVVGENLKSAKKRMGTYERGLGSNLKELLLVKAGTI